MMMMIRESEECVPISSVIDLRAMQREPWSIQRAVTLTRHRPQPMICIRNSSKTRTHTTDNMESEDKLSTMIPSVPRNPQHHAVYYYLHTNSNLYHATHMVFRLEQPVLYYTSLYLSLHLYRPTYFVWLWYETCVLEWNYHEIVGMKLSWDVCVGMKLSWDVCSKETIMRCVCWN
jgi:hypothetical protein